MLDQFGRDIHYLRLSVTERCTLQCAYCRAGEGLCPKARELNGENLLRIARICASLGFTKIRLTGGEPLLRKDLCQILQGLTAMGGYTDISMTTNAQRLPGRVRQLRDAGLMRVNISLDTLREDRYRALTGNGSLSPVLSSIKEALHAQMPVKLNTVLLRGVNDDEADDFMRLAAQQPLEVRFIELMPLGLEDRSAQRISTDALMALYPQLVPLPVSDPSQPAKCYSMPGWKGSVGFISPISHRFCGQCNRVRVMSDGMLRPCLGNNREISLLNALEREDDLQLRDTIYQAVWKKPASHNFCERFVSDKNMSRIGG